jgi:hypothetical protein
VGDEEIELDELHMVLEIKLELAHIVDLEEKKGFEDSWDLQAGLERIALSHDEDIEERGELLGQGLPWMLLVSIMVSIMVSIIRVFLTSLPPSELSLTKRYWPHTQAHYDVDRDINDKTR